MANDSTKVSFGKPKVGGAIFTAPLGSTLPTAASGELDSAFKCLGYISEDGVSNSNSPSVNKLKAWGGDIVATNQTEKPDTWKMKYIESLNIDVLKVIYGDDNVSGALSTGITVRANSKEQPARAYVIDMALPDGTLKRVVIPNAKVSEIGEIVYKDTDPIAYDVTLDALPGDENFDFDTHKEYIIKAEG